MSVCAIVTGNRSTLSYCGRTNQLAFAGTDRVLHDAEVIVIEGESYRLKEAKERSENRLPRQRSTKA